MSSSQATAEVFWTAFRALSKTEKKAFYTKLLGEREFHEDIIDLAIIEQRKHEPSRTLDEYLTERRRKKL